MRFLNKIVFINSATVQYAEVQVDGNVHFIGTQGVGKSTLLRAILFFYNADVLKLGISKEKKTFSEYYFPFQNAYLVYEVIGAKGPYCILAYKSQGKPCFRFINSAYKPAYFIAADGLAYEHWDGIKQILIADNISYSSKVERYDQYRDILYGNHTAKEFEDYAVLESRQYQNIPRTIQNVFLNSKLEAEFIKQTIIMSLNEENIEINLQNYTHHLKSFQAQLKDMELYRQPHVQKQAEQVIQLQLACLYQEKEKNNYASKLAWAIGNIRKQVPRLNVKMEHARIAKETLEEKRITAGKRYTAKVEKIQAQISVIENDLKKIKEKNEFYTRQNITEALEKVALHKNLAIQLEHRLAEKQLLLTPFTAPGLQYDALLQSLNNELAAFEKLWQNNLLDWKNTAFLDKQAAADWFDTTRAEIYLQHQEQVQEAREQVLFCRNKMHDIEVKKAVAKQERFFEAEAAELQATINNLLVAIPQAEHLLESCNLKMEMVQKQWELDVATEQQRVQKEATSIAAELQTKQQRLELLEQRLEEAGNSFYSWLNANTKGWEHNIGKICDEALLFSSKLNPVKVENDTSFYGVHINLKELPASNKSGAQYDREKKALEKDIQELQEALNTLKKEQADKQEKLKRKYQPQVRDAKERRTEQKYLLERRNSELQQAKLRLKDVYVKADNEKRAQLAAMDEQLVYANDTLMTATDALLKVEQSIDKQIKLKERELYKKFTVIAEELAEKTTIAEQEAIQYKAVISSAKAAVSAELSMVLENEGADTGRLNTVTEAVMQLQNDLRYIEEKRDLVVEYNKDKRELLDKGDELKSKKLLLEQAFANEAQKIERQLAGIDQEIELARQMIQVVELQIMQAGEDSASFEAFEHTETYQGISSLYKEEKEMHQTDQRCRALIDQINSCFYSGKDYLDKLKEAATKFIGNFSRSNVFKFPDSLSHTQDYHEFAHQLNEFINNSKMDELERRMNERFANIINLLGKETDVLMSKGGEIQTVINNINKDFDHKNFVGAIKKIELRLDDSANSVVQTLLQIKLFNDQHGYDLGGLNLFSTVDQTEKNKKAVVLLEQLNKAIVEYKRDIITLSDSFELKFRVEENQNDTGWVEKLSNVGSEGTDVLVKAMINIMLLNVFKEGASKRFSNFRLHCMMDEIGKLHPSNVKGILQFANDRNIMLINGSPTESNALDYKHIYKLEKDSDRNTRVKRIVSHYN